MAANEVGKVFLTTTWKCFNKREEEYFHSIIDKQAKMAHLGTTGTVNRSGDWRTSLMGSSPYLPFSCSFSFSLL